MLVVKIGDAEMGGTSHGIPGGVASDPALSVIAGLRAGSRRIIGFPFLQLRVCWPIDDSHPSKVQADNRQTIMQAITRLGRDFVTPEEESQYRITES